MDPFERLAQQVSREAAGVKCSPAEYREGLTVIIEHLESDRDASEATNPEE